MAEGYKVFVIDGYVYTECVRRAGKLICKADGFYKFPLYGKRINKLTPIDEDQSVAEEI